METKAVLKMAEVEQNKTVAGLIRAILHYPKLKISVGVRGSNDVYYMEYPRAKMLKELEKLDDSIEMDWMFSNFYPIGATIMIG